MEARWEASGSRAGAAGADPGARTPAAPSPAAVRTGAAAGTADCTPEGVHLKTTQTKNITLVNFYYDIPFVFRVLDFGWRLPWVFKFLNFTFAILRLKPHQIQSMGGYLFLTKMQKGHCQFAVQIEACG